MWNVNLPSSSSYSFIRFTKNFFLGGGGHYMSEMLNFYFLFKCSGLKFIFVKICCVLSLEIVN